MGRVCCVGFVLPLLIALSTAGCGGSSGGSGGGVQPTTVVLSGEAALDGYVDTAGTAVSNSGGPWTGDLDSFTPNLGARQFFSFDLTALPAGVTVTQATLELQQAVVNGTPYATHGVVVADHVDFGAALDSGDFAAAALQSAIGVLSADASVGLKTLDVTANVQADLAAVRTHSQYRVRFTVLDTDNDGANDHAVFVDSEHSNFGTGPVPHLVVVYQP